MFLSYYFLATKAAAFQRLFCYAKEDYNLQPVTQSTQFAPWHSEC